MRTEAVITILPQKVPAELYEALTHTFPEGKLTYIFRLRVPENSPQHTKILELLRAAGFKPWLDQSRRKEEHEFSFRIDRIYDRSDWTAAEYLQPFSDTCLDDVGDRNKEGLLELNPDFLRRRPQVGSAGNGLLVSDTIRERLQEAQLAHLLFRPAVVVTENPAGFPVKYWEITSDFVLPPLAPGCVLQNLAGAPWDEKTGNSCMVVEEPYSPSELHYRRQDLQAAGPFDVAVTREPLLGKNTGDLVVSKRFYEVSKRHKIKYDWWPVRIDP
jgi:hypothetical protein